MLETDATVTRSIIRALGYAFALAGVALTITSCGGSTAPSADQLEAQHVAVRWLGLMQGGDIAAACKLMDAENHNPHAEYPNWSPAKNCEEMWLHSDNTPLAWKPNPNAVTIWGASEPKVLEVTVDGDQATVFIDGAAMRRPVWLRKEHGHWLVDGVEYPI